MDPITAVGLASSVLSFIDFGWKLVQGADEIYGSARGMSAFLTESVVVQEDLARICKNLDFRAVYLPYLSEDEKALQTIVAECHGLAVEFGDVLAKLKASHPHRVFESVKKAFATVWRDKEVKGYLARLDNLRSQLMLVMLTIINNTQSQLRNDIAVSIHDAKLEVIQKLEEVAVALPGLSRARDELEKDVAVLNSLRYPAMRNRHHGIHTAHGETFEWIFTPSDPPAVDGPGLLEWLESSSGFFWIRGKAGSGKSTLMKWLYQDNRTFDALRRWAGSEKLFTAHHYFWKAGNFMQKSQEGLLQSLVYDIFRNAPALIRALSPQRWRMAGKVHADEPWTRHELKDILKRLHGSSSLTQSSKFCFFIDGLDEYEGDHLELIDLIVGLARATNVKICVSSRPWQEFIEAFEATATPSLRLEQLSAADIRSYVNDKFMEIPKYVRLCTEDNRYAGLVQGIVDRASGVFLWVFLVVRAMRPGFIRGDTIEDCWKRLNTIPTDLNEFFQVILDSVDPTYHEEAARILQVLSTARDAPVLYTMSFFSDPALKAAFLDKKTLDNKQTLKRVCTEGQIRIESRCRDLVEVVEHSPALQNPWLWRVEFLHHTVREFVQSDEVQAMLKARMKTRFNPNSYLARACLLRFKLLHLSFTEEEVRRNIIDMVSYALAVEKECEIAEFATLNHLEEFILSQEAFFKSTCEHVLQLQGSGLRPGWMTAIAIQYGCTIYVSERLARELAFQRKIQGQLFLELALTLPLNHVLEFDFLHHDLRMVQVLLEYGLMPTDTYYVRRLWNQFFAKGFGDMLAWREPNNEHKRTRAAIVMELIDYSADKDATLAHIYWDKAPEYYFSVLRKGCLPTDLVKIRKLLQKKVDGLSETLTINPRAS